jgi:hypothetical protein
MQGVFPEHAAKKMPYQGAEGGFDARMSFPGSKTGVCRECLGEHAVFCVKSSRKVNIFIGHQMGVEISYKIISTYALRGGT